jgi:predicted DNA-binding transcriptional regulator AlpA
MKRINNEIYYTISETAQLLNISTSWLYDHMSDFPFIKVNTGKRNTHYISKSELNKLLNPEILEEKIEDNSTVGNIMTELRGCVRN